MGPEMPSEVTTLLGENVQMVCHAEGTPSPTIQWLKDGKAISTDDSERIRFV